MSNITNNIKKLAERSTNRASGRDDYDDFDDSRYADIGAFERGKIPEPKSALHKFWHGEGKQKKVSYGGTSDLYGGQENYDDGEFPELGDNSGWKRKHNYGKSTLRKKRVGSKPKRKIVKKPVKKCRCKK